MQKRFIFFFGIALAIMMMAWFAYHARYAQPRTDAQVVQIQIEESMGIRTVADLLQEKSIISSSYGYRFYGFLNPETMHVRSGTYALKPGMNYRSIARMLALGPPRDEVTVKVVNGWDLRDEARMLQEFSVSTSTFMEHARVSAWRDDFAFMYALPESASLEGYLFPDTYRVWKDQLPDSLIRKQLEEFAKHADRITLEAKKQGRTLLEVVTLASIVEKEVSTPEDRKIVAGIFLNRIADGMMLQSDATVNYVTQTGRTRSTQNDLNIDSPYNTYHHVGLPPGPICNPGEDALEAALNPTPSSYRYFLTDSNGKVYYGKTFQEHQRNRQKAFGN